jgi:hypothetical protein
MIKKIAVLGAGHGGRPAATELTSGGFNVTTRACREIEPCRIRNSRPSLNHRHVYKDAGYGLVPFSELRRIAGVEIPTIDSLIVPAEMSLGVDFRRTGLTLDRMGLAGKSPTELGRFLELGH